MNEGKTLALGDYESDSRTAVDLHYYLYFPFHMLKIFLEGVTLGVAEFLFKDGLFMVL